MTKYLVAKYNNYCLEIIMKTTDFIKEDIGEDAHAMHQDHEVQMARQDCYNAAKDAIALHKLLKNISEMQGLDGWVSEKITLAADYLKTVYDYLEYEVLTQKESVLPAFEMESAEQKLGQALNEEASLGDSAVQDAITGTVEKLFHKNEISDYGALEAVRQGVKHHFSKPGATVDSAVEGILNILNKRRSKSGNHLDLGRFKEALRQGIAHQLKKQGVAEGYTGRETKHGTWRVFKDGDPVAVAGPFNSREEASAWIKKQKQGVAEGSSDVIKSVMVGNFRHDLVDTGVGYQVRIYTGDDLYHTDLTKSTLEKGLKSLADNVAHTKKLIGFKDNNKGVAEGEYNPDTFVPKQMSYKGYGLRQDGPYEWSISASARKFPTLAAAKRHIDKHLIVDEGFPYDVDHMPGPVVRNADMTTDNVKTKDKAEWGRAVDSINARVFDDMSEFRSDSKGERVVGNSAVWAKWDNATQTGWFNAKGRPLKPWPVKEAKSLPSISDIDREFKDLDNQINDLEAKGIDVNKDHPLSKKWHQLVDLKQKALRRATKPVKEATAGHSWMIRFALDTDRAYQAVMDRFSDVIEWDKNGNMMVPQRIWPKVGEVAFAADGIGAELIDESVTEDASDLNIGDPVIITGNVEHEGSAGEIVNFGKDKNFVIVNVYGHGTRSFHAANVRYDHESDLAGDDEEDDDQDDGFYVAISDEDDGVFIGAFAKEGGRWREQQVSGKAPYGWGGTFMSYLTPSDIMQHLRNDYRRGYEVKGPMTWDEAQEYAESMAESSSRSIKEVKVKDVIPNGNGATDDPRIKLKKIKNKIKEYEDLIKQHSDGITARVSDIMAKRDRLVNQKEKLEKMGVKEDASAGASSAGAVAAVATPLMKKMIKRKAK